MSVRRTALRGTIRRETVRVLIFPCQLEIFLAEKKALEVSKGF